MALLFQHPFRHERLFIYFNFYFNFIFYYETDYFTISERCYTKWTDFTWFTKAEACIALNNEAGD
jgi:hypothetical protein